MSDRIDTSRLVELMAPTLGQAKSHDAVMETAKELSLNSAYVTPEEAVLLLQRLEEQPGLIGIVARLAKARIRLQITKERSRRKNED